MSDQKPEWREIPEQTIIPEPVQRAQDLLLKLRGAIEQMVEQDQQRIAILREQHHRLKHGGGS